MANEFLELIRLENDPRGYILGYADDFLPISGSVQWLQETLDRFCDFCASKGLKINPDKCVMTCSSTIASAESGLLLPELTIQGRPIQYSDQNKYLGFWLTSTLSSDVHMQKILSKLRKSILLFKSACKIRKRSLLLTIAQTYIVPVLHNLEFVGKVKRAQIQRFDYLLRRFFMFKSTADYEKFKKRHNFLNLEKLHANARKRFHNDF